MSTRIFYRNIEIKIYIKWFHATILASRKHPKISNDAVLINKNLCSDFQRIIGQYLFQGTIIKTVDIKAFFHFIRKTQTRHSVSCRLCTGTTRARKPAEVDGDEYVFMSKQDMENDIQNKRLVLSKPNFKPEILWHKLYKFLTL